MTRYINIKFSTAIAMYWNKRNNTRKGIYKEVKLAHFYNNPQNM